MSQEARLKQIRSDLRRGRRARIYLWFKIGFLISAVLSFSGIYCYFNYWHYDFDKKLVGQFLNFIPPLTTEILDKNGKVLIELEGVYDWSKPIAERAPEYRHLIKYGEIPEVMIQALLAAEDQFFFSHNGLDFWGIARATGENIIESAKETRRGGKLTIVFAQGASTISQQDIVLSKLSGQDSNRGLSAKIKKMRMAIWLEKELTKRLGRNEAKKRIFEIFANTSYCGEGRYGIYDGMKAFFGKDLKSLTKDDAPYAATVAGTFRSPKKYSPYMNPREALNRRNGILKIMAKHGFITEEEFLKFKEYPLGVISTSNVKTEAPAAVSYILKNLSADKKSLIWRNGEVIKSTIDIDVQRVANVAVRAGLDQYKELQVQHAAESKFDEDRAFFLSRVDGVQGAMVVMENKTGNVLAMVGAHNANYPDFNRAAEALRQPGSAFKPILYGAAIVNGADVWRVDCLREGLGQCKVFDGSGMTVSMGRNRRRHRIQNYTYEFYGWIPIWYALAKSQNSAAMWIAKQLGPEAIVNFAHTLGLNRGIEVYPTTAIGAEEVTVLELTAAYSVFPSDGEYFAPRLITEVKDQDGNVTLPLYENYPVLTKLIADEMVELLRHTVLYRSGTGRSLNEPGFGVQVAGKTGTTNDYRDAWFCGFTTEITVCNWVGRDDNTPLGTDKQMGIIKDPNQLCSPLHPKKKEYCSAGAKTAIPAVKKFFADYYKDRIPPKFPEEMDNWIRYVHDHDKHPKR